MGSNVLALDTILSATFYFVRLWSPECKRNQSRDLLRFLLCRLYDQSRGQLIQGQVTLAQGTLARKLGLSRQWVAILCGRLQEAGWIEYYAPVLEDGMRGSCIFRIGRMLKRLLVMLGKARWHKKPKRMPVNNPWQFSPLDREKKQALILEQENTPPKPELLKRMPLLQRWLERGKTGS